MEASTLRAWWAHRQGLLGELTEATPVEVLQRSGWSRSVGGVHPYLTIFARSRGSRESVDQAMVDRSVLELPAARGCTYVLPRSDFAMGLAIGKPSREGEMVMARKLGVTDQEIARLCEKVVDALKEGDKDPAELKKAVGDASRNLGEEGKKKGIITTIPLALGLLQAEGKILRKPLNGRLDTQRYAYTYWSDSPVMNPGISRGEALLKLAHLFFRWIGPASIAHFAWFTAQSLKASKAIIDQIPVVPFTSGSDLLILMEDVEPLQSFVSPKEPIYRLVGALDSLFLLRRDIRSHLEEADYERHGPTSKVPAQSGTLQDLSNNAIVDRGRIVGLWEYDFSRSEIAWHSFIEPSAELREEVARTETYIRHQLGDARSFSLDSPQSRQPLIDSIRALGT